MDPFICLQRSITEIETLLSTRKDGLISGNMKTFDEYRYQCGLIHGLELALEELKNQAVHME